MAKTLHLRPSDLESKVGQMVTQKVSQRSRIVLTQDQLHSCEISFFHPQIFEAASTNETLALVEFDFPRTSPDGKESVYETIKLTDATISSVKRYIGFPDAGEPPDPRQLEDVSFSFSKIEITHSDGGTMFIDNWNSQL